jgi:hypothetical protein
MEPKLFRTNRRKDEQTDITKLRKVKDRCCGAHLALPPLKADCTLAPEVVPSVISRSAPHQVRERPLLANEGNRKHEFCQQPGILLQLDSLTCPIVGTWVRLFNFPSEGRHAEDFYIRKIQRLRPGLNPRTREPEASMLTTRPPKPS